ncbi:MAG: adenylyltransferase/cytidyltransferase family protein, partial [Neisseriaceae bacterium]|nr:adenylyltransferase/cytidyltransferase family protein [Neisseriaceae bacterium]
MSKVEIAFEKKILPAEKITSQLKNSIHPVVFTNGCFDILHRGHVTYLAEAKALGQSLIVALNTDESVKRQGKGEDRPINTLDNRMAVIAALVSVDFV